MNAPAANQIIFWRPTGASILFHALVLAALTLNWTQREPAVTVQPRDQPKFIEARLIDASQLKPRKKPAVVKSKPVAAKPRPKPAPTRPKTAPPQPRPVEKAPAKPEPEPAQVLSPAEQAALARRELALAMDAEDLLLEEASDEDVAQSYIALIGRTVQNNWSRPPSARNGMEAELIIQLIPTGEVVSVTIDRSSGLLAFDRSAVNAVQKAQRFNELQQLPSRVFEKSFRRFRLLFKPEDLRF